VAKRFGGREITFVGDRGMIKTPQIEALGERQFHYITAITKPQIEALLKSDVLQLDLFDETLACSATIRLFGVLPHLKILPSDSCRCRPKKQSVFAHCSISIE
jgi:hypothetical protein